MVCLGNICRSPLAEGIMRHLVNEQHLDWQIASAGTGSWHVGQAPDSRSIAIAQNFGYDISAQRARHFNKAMFEQFDHILVMDRNNLKDVLALATTPAQRQKVKLFLDDEEVADPYYDNALFEPVCAQVEKRCKELIEEFRGSF
nr:low molecular weight protein-tyrosine-phosphatase [Pedobacter sp. ASV12]